MKLSIFILSLILVQFATAQTWYSFAPYTTATCSAGTQYGIGYSFRLNSSLNTCTSNVEGTFYMKTSDIVSGSTIKIQQYAVSTSSYCGSTYIKSYNSNYTLGVCNDAKYHGFSMPNNNLKYSRNFMVTSGTTPSYPTTAGATKNVVLYTFYTTNCQQVIGYQYYNGYTEQYDPVNVGDYYAYTCDGNVPKKAYCGVDYGCEEPLSIAQATCSSSNPYMAKTVTCV